MPKVHQRATARRDLVEHFVYLARPILLKKLFGQASEMLFYEFQFYKVTLPRDEVQP